MHHCPAPPLEQAEPTSTGGASQTDAWGYCREALTHVGHPYFVLFSWRCCAAKRFLPEKSCD